jgi:hypothetical protein
MTGGYLTGGCPSDLVGTSGRHVSRKRNTKYKFERREVVMESSTIPVTVPPSRRGRVIGAVFGVMGYGFSAASGICLAGWLLPPGRWLLPPGNPLDRWFSAVGLPAAGACLTSGTIWLYARRAWLAGQAGAAWAYCGLGVAVLVAVIGLSWPFDSIW